jgi:hypothetical protein
MLSSVKKTEVERFESIKSIIDVALENALSDIYDNYNINSGDLSPDQDVEYNKIVEEAAILFKSIMDNNKKVS